MCIFPFIHFFLLSRGYFSIFCCIFFELFIFVWLFLCLPRRNTVLILPCELSYSLIFLICICLLCVHNFGYESCSKINLLSHYPWKQRIGYIELPSYFLCFKADLNSRCHIYDFLKHNLIFIKIICEVRPFCEENIDRQEQTNPRNCEY